MIKPLDILLLFLLAWGAYSGFKKGFVLELFAIASLFVATIGSIKLLDKLISLYTQWQGEMGTWIPYVLFILLFIFLVLMVTFVGKLLKRLIHLTVLGSVDHIVGAVLGAFKWALLISSLVWVTDLLHITLPKGYVEHTTLFPIIQSLAPKLMGFIADWFPALQNLFKNNPLPNHKMQLHRLSNH